MWFSFSRFWRVERLAQFFAFALVGAVGTALHYAVMFAGMSAFAWAPGVATTLGAVCGAVVNYVLNYYFTFRSAAAHRSAFVKFMIVAGAGVALNGLVLVGLVSGLAIPVMPAQLAATAAVLAWGFLANRAWTFKGPPA